MNISNQIIIDNAHINWVTSGYKFTLKEWIISEAFSNAFNVGIDKYFPEYTGDTSVSIISWQCSNDGFEVSVVDYGIIDPLDLFQLLGEVENWVNKNIRFILSAAEKQYLEIGINESEELVMGL